MSGTQRGSREKTVRLLVASSDEQDQIALEGLLGSECHCHRAHDRQELRAFLKRHRPRVVICDEQLPDGDWRDVLADVQTPDGAPRLILLARHPDERLWAEMLNLGGYDLLLKPIERFEARRIIRMATQPSVAAAG